MHCSEQHKQKDRHAAVSPKPDQVFCLGNCESSRAVTRPTPSPPAEQTTAREH
jgi:hypothetical protein